MLFQCILAFVYCLYAAAAAGFYIFFPTIYKSLFDSLPLIHFTMTGSLLILVGGYLLFSLPYHIFHQFCPGMQKYKVQQRIWTLKEQWTCIKDVAFSHTAIYLPAAIVGYHLIVKNNLILLTYETIPPWYSMLVRVGFAMIFEDTWHYWNHRLLHTTKLYGMVHKKHHTYQSPFPLAAEYASPIETMWLGLGFFIPNFLVSSHITVFWCWLIVRLLQTTDVHSGYYCPWFNPLYLIPFYGGVRFHDFHHQNFIGNYGSSFIYWDWLCGTDKEFHQMQLKKASKKGTTNKAC